MGWRRFVREQSWWVVGTAVTVLLPIVLLGWSWWFGVYGLLNLAGIALYTHWSAYPTGPAARVLQVLAVLWLPTGLVALAHLDSATSPTEVRPVDGAGIRPDPSHRSDDRSWRLGGREADFDRRRR